MLGFHRRPFQTQHLWWQSLQSQNFWPYILVCCSQVQWQPVRAKREINLGAKCSRPTVSDSLLHWSSSSQQGKGYMTLWISTELYPNIALRYGGITKMTYHCIKYDVEKDVQIHLQYSFPKSFEKNRQLQQTSVKLHWSQYFASHRVLYFSREMNLHVARAGKPHLFCQTTN